MSKRSKILRIVFIVGSIALGLLLAVMVLGAYLSYRDYSDYTDEDSYKWSAEYGNYTSLLYTANSDCDESDDTEMVGEYKALAAYFEAACLVKAYEEAGDEEAAGQMRQRMEEYASKCPSCKEQVSDIDSQVFSK